MNTLAQKIIDFNKDLILNDMPRDITVLNPFINPETRYFSELFYEKYYNDANKRIFLVGINPGRFGAGITGVCFVDPIKLQNDCEIENPFNKKAELSSDFIFRMIHAFGGPDKFFNHFLLTALCPLGFIKNGKNINYYDDKALLQDSKPFIVEKMKEQISMGAERRICFCIGEGANFKYFKKWNDEFHFFEQIVPLPHPRFIMQYKRKKLDEYIDLYINSLRTSIY